MKEEKMSSSIAPLREFVRAMTWLVSSAREERELLAEGRRHLAALISGDRWLPDEFAMPLKNRYGQYLLHCDPMERFSVVSLAWGAGQRTPIHNHTVWGLVGVLRGAENCEEFELRDGVPRETGRVHTMRSGNIEAVSPTIGDWHRVSSAAEASTSISIHVYGANIGALRRHRLDELGKCCEFVSGYDNTAVPNLWHDTAAVPIRKAYE